MLAEKKLQWLVRAETKQKTVTATEIEVIYDSVVTVSYTQLEI